MKALILPFLTIATVAASERPNIILFMVDDMGWQDTSVPFHTDTTVFNRFFQTPNMERLAEKGMKFTNAYAAPVSTPTRVSMITGVNPTRHHVTNWTAVEKNKPTDGKNKLLEFGGWNYNGFSPEEGIESTFHGTPLPQLLKGSGYTTLHVGKAHFASSGTPGAEPLNVGFDYNIGGSAIGGPRSFLGSDYYGNSKEGPTPRGVRHLEKYHGTDTYLTEALTIESLKLMDEALEGDKPFFLYLSHYAVHIPFNIDPRFYAKYKKLGYEEQEARYAALVEGMDKSLGDVMDYLEEKNIAENTVLLFMSDNGGYTIGVRSETFDGMSKNTPLRAGKGSLYEGGIREPMLAYVPNITKAGSVNHSQVIIEDFFPTILELAGAKNTAKQKLDSKSFVGALKGKDINHKRPFYWHYPNDWGVRQNECGAPRSAILVGDMKLIHDYETASNELYNIREDIGETRNLLEEGKEYKKTAKRLAKQLSNKLRNEQAPMPTRKDTGKPCAYPDQTI